MDAFCNCHSLTSVTIANSVTSIGESAFANCSSLISITIPSSVTSISSCVFSNCGSLTSVTIPNGVTSIGSYAIVSCASLPSITIPNSVTNIDEFAFADCIGLKDVYCYAENVPQTGEEVFGYTPIASATLHVPAGSIDKYKTTSPWSEFGNIVALTTTGNSIIKDKFTINTPNYFDLQGLRLSGKPARGIYIEDGMKKVIK